MVLGLFVFAAGAIVKHVTTQITIILRGYPPFKDQPETFERNSCNHDDNLTEHCIKAGGNCATQAECDAEIAKRTPLPVTAPAPKEE